MKLHLPTRLRKALLACFAAVSSVTFATGSAWADTYNLLADQESWVFTSGRSDPSWVDGAIKAQGWMQSIATYHTTGGQVYNVDNTTNTLTFTITYNYENEYAYSCTDGHAFQEFALVGSTQAIVLGTPKYQTTYGANDANQIGYGISTNTTADVYATKNEGWEGGIEFATITFTPFENVTREVGTYTLTGVVTKGETNYTLDLSMAAGEGEAVTYVDDLDLGASFDINKVIMASDGPQTTLTALTIEGALADADIDIPTVTIEGNDTYDNRLINTPAAYKIILNMDGQNNDYLYASSYGSVFTIANDVEIQSAIINNGNGNTTYKFTGTITGTGEFKRPSGAATYSQHYEFSGDMSAYSGNMSLLDNSVSLGSGDTLLFNGNTSGTGTITVSGYNQITVAGATMNNSAIDATYMTISGASSFVGDVTVSTLLSIGANTAITLGAEADLTLGEGALIDLANATYTEDAVGTRTYSIFAAGSTGTHNLADLTAAMIKDAAEGYGYSFADGAIIMSMTSKDFLLITTRQTGRLEYNHYSSVEFRDIFEDSSQGGAIYGGVVDIVTLSENGSVTFSGNSANSTSNSAYGGAIYGEDYSTFTLSDNGSVTFSGNTASGKSAYGGAIYGRYYSTITLSGNESVTFSGNTASGKSAYGGAIYVDYSTITLRGNDSVEFVGNRASGSDMTLGGAIYGAASSTVTLSGNGSVVFSGNMASSTSSCAYGGAIYSEGSLRIRNNDSVLFEKNVEKNGSAYRLRSINAGGRGKAIYLSAAADKSMEFRDSVYIASGSTVILNGDYTDAEGVVHKQQGDIIFTGKYAEQHLNEMLAADGLTRKARITEIRNSRTTIVETSTNLYGGRLCVEDGAIYQGYGITVMEGSNATVRVKDATLSHRGYFSTFNDGTTLEIGGISEINGDIELLSGSTLNILDGATMTLSEDFLMIAETGSRIHLENNATLDLAGELEAGESVMVELSKGAAVSRDGIAISNMGATDVALLDAVSFAAGSMQKVENMHVVIDSNENTNIDYQLVNSSVENRGSGKLTVTHAQNSITAVRSEGGAIDILNVDTSDAGTVLKLATLELHGGATFGAYTGSSVDAAQEAWVQVSGSAVFGKGTTINADLELMEGCSLTLGGTVDMGSNLRINGTLTLDGELLAQIQAAEIGASFDLFTGIDTLYLSGVQYDSIALSDNMAASTYFVGLEDSLEAERGYRLTYASATPGEGVLSVHVVTIPEPTTATLNFLALAGLMLRRRRK